MGNVTAGADGRASVDYVDPQASFEGANDVLGRGVIVHEKGDDLKTQPTGNAGGRLACGVDRRGKGAVGSRRQLSTVRPLSPAPGTSSRAGPGRPQTFRPDGPSWPVCR